MRLMSKGEYLIVPKGTKFTGSEIRMRETCGAHYAHSSTLHWYGGIYYWPRRIGIMHKARGVTSEPLCEKKNKLVEIFVVASLKWENVISFR